MPRWTPSQVQSFLAEHLPQVRLFTAQPFTGGFWNDVLHLTTSDGDLVFKHYRPVLPGTLFPNLPASEAQALHRLSGLNVAPDLVGFWPDADILIYRYVPGPEWQGDVTAAAHLMRRQRGANPTGFRTVPTTAADILAQADTILRACTPDATTRRLLACRPVAQHSDAGPTCLIHTDPAAANLIGHGAGLRLIDWQCPAAGDLAEDVAVLFAPSFLTLYNRPLLTQTQRRTFLDIIDDPALETRLTALEPAYGWRLAAYCARRMQTTDRPGLAHRYRAAALAEASRLEAPPHRSGLPADPKPVV